MTSIALAPSVRVRLDTAFPRRAGCRTRGCSCAATTSLATLPNVVTVSRTLVSAALTVVAVTATSWPLLLAAVAAYWVGDVADGLVARAFGSETRFGAALDIVCDRACCALVLLGAVALDPSYALPVAIYLLAFVVVDTLLSLTFLAWPLLGVNYLRHVDERVWLLNFSPPAKLLNSGTFLPLLLTGHSYAAAGGAATVVVLKVLSLRRMLRPLLTRPSECLETAKAAS